MLSTPYNVTSLMPLLLNYLFYIPAACYAGVMCHIICGILYRHALCMLPIFCGYGVGIICVVRCIICHLCNAAHNMYHTFFTFTTFFTLYHIIYAFYIPLNTTTYNVPSLYASLFIHPRHSIAYLYHGN